MSTPSGSNAKLAIVAAVLVGLFAIVALNRYIREKTTLPEPPKVCVLAATAEIPAGADIADEWLTALSLPAEGLSNLHVVLPNRDDPAFAAAFAEAKTKFVGRPAKRLVANALRMRPDRIVVGECRGGEALDMLQAMNTGHDGSLTTVHANTPRDTVARLETLCLMAGMDLPLSAIRAQIVSAVNLIVQTARLSDGSRKVIAITEVLGLGEHGQARLRDLFVFRQTGVDPATRKVLGHHEAVGRPSFLGEFALRGIILRALAGRRRDRLRAELPDALDMLANSLRAGLTLPQALARNLSRFPPRIGAEFARILYDTRLGYALGDAFENFGRRLPIAEVNLVVIASKIGVSYGGNLAESYSMLSSLIRDNLAFEAELRAMTTEGRMQAIVMSCLPFALLLILLLVRREVVLPLFRTGAGLATLLVMAAMQALAYLWIRKIVEVRV